MITRTITGKTELLTAMADLIPATSPLSAEFTRGETVRTLPDGARRAKKNATFTITIEVNGGARDN